MVIQRLFGLAAPAFSGSESPPPANRRPVEQIRESLQTLLHDCKDMRSQRVLYKISVAQTPSELWMLRSDLHQCISQAHTQTEAADRINTLIDVFEGWMPADRLTRI